MSTLKRISLADTRLHTLTPDVQIGLSGSDTLLDTPERTLLVSSLLKGKLLEMSANRRVVFTGFSTGY